MKNKSNIRDLVVALFVVAGLALATYHNITGDMLNATYMVCLAVLGVVSVKSPTKKEEVDLAARHWWHVTRSYTSKGVVKFASSAIATNDKCLPAFALFLQTKEEGDITDKDPDSQITVSSIAYLGYMTQEDFVSPAFELFGGQNKKDLN